MISGLLKIKDQKLIDEFKRSPYSKGFQLGMISPVLYCLDSDFLVINSKNATTVNYLLEKRVVDTRLSNYFSNITTIKQFLSDSEIPEFDSYDFFDMFCHWMCTKNLGGYAVIKPVKDGVSTTAPSPPETQSKEKQVPEFKSDHTFVEWTLLYIGAHSKHETWVTSSDRNKVFSVKPLGKECIETLPDLGLGRETRRIVERIDVLWLKKNKVAAAFEVEHTTSITSGLNRLNDLMISTPNLKFDLFIVAPDDRIGKLNAELTRPTYSNLRGIVKWLPYSTIEKSLSVASSILVLGGTLPSDFLTMKAMGT